MHGVGHHDDRVDNNGDGDDWPLTMMVTTMEVADDRPDGE